MANKDNLEPQDWGSSENALDKWKVHAFPITKENKHFYQSCSLVLIFDKEFLYY